jgi:hypothetical protein
VILPNHLHLILYYSGGQQSLNTIIGNGKRFMAYKIIKRLQEQRESSLLKKLQADVKSKDKARGKKHMVWINTFDVKECRTEKFILQKLCYIHNNPWSGKWKLVKDIMDYPHSSAFYYISGKHKGYIVRDYREFLKPEIDDD